MKILLFVITMLFTVIACNNKNEYTISINVENGPDSVMIFNNWYTSSDTNLIIDGKCEFIGVIDSFPKLVSLGFHFPSQKRTQIILDPGNIKVSYTKLNGFIIGGTPNNSKLQNINEELAPYNKKITETWRNWNLAYRKKDRSKEECESTFTKYMKAKKIKAAKQRDLIRENHNYAGLVTTLSLNRYETAVNLKSYLEEFKEFSADRRYNSIEKLYECAAKTTAGSHIPTFTFPDPDGNMISLSNFKGKWVLIDFWYSGCHWCRKMTPHLINIYNDWNESKNFEIVSISVDKPKDRKKWIKAIEDDKATWTQVWDSTKTYPLEFGISGYPTLILVDPEGKGTIKIVGYHEEGSLKRLFEEQMKK
jgi:thiol-disulfide isomerase/thioredoxin